MYPPGRIIWLERKGDIWETNYEGNDMEAQWITGRQLLAKGLRLGISMVEDHAPFNVWRRVRGLIHEPTTDMVSH